MKILNVTSCLGLKKGSGTAERTFQMSRYLAAEDDIECSVLTLNLDLDNQRVKDIHPATVDVLPLLMERFYIPAGGVFRMAKAVRDSDVIHLMGHWDVLNVLCFFLCKFYGKPYVVCPAGALPVYGRSRILKRIFNRLIGGEIVKASAAKVAITEREKLDFVSYGVNEKNVVVIPNGVTCNYKNTEASDSFETDPYILFMGRLNSIKGPDILIDAFSEMNHGSKGMNLIFAGPDGGMYSELMQTVKAKNLQNKVKFLGFVEGEKKSHLYKNADILVVPSRSEAMSIVALEAAMHGTVALVSDQCGLSEVRCIDECLEFELSSNDLKESMEYVLSDRELLNKFSDDWRKYVTSHYTWSIQTQKYIKLYNKVIGK